MMWLALVIYFGCIALLILLWPCIERRLFSGRVVRSSGARMGPPEPWPDPLGPPPQDEDPENDPGIRPVMPRFRR
jgi:hypothetical protein